jgi:hypothetical protein
VLCALAAIALSNDAFQTSRPRAQAASSQKEAVEPSVPLDSLAQYALGLAWTPPASGADPQVAAAYFSDISRLTPLERARLRPRRPLPVSDEPFQVSLIEATPQEQAEALLTAMRDAEALGLRLQVAD